MYDECVYGRVQQNKPLKQSNVIGFYFWNQQINVEMRKSSATRVTSPSAFSLRVTHKEINQSKFFYIEY